MISDHDRLKKLTRAVWLLFQASEPVGMGFLHVNAAEKVTEDTVLNPRYITKTDADWSVYMDYWYGRMVKTEVSVDNNGQLAINAQEPRSDYQSWARRYPSANDFITNVEASLV